MVVNYRGYSKEIYATTLPDGRVMIKESVTYCPDANTEIFNHAELPLRDLTDKELNEIMEELERGAVKIEDTLPLKSIRQKVLNE